MVKSYTHLFLFIALCFSFSLKSQNVVKGFVFDGVTSDAIIGANVIITGTNEGTITDWDGSFEFTTANAYPLNIEVTYIGYEDNNIVVTSENKLKILMQESTNLLTEIVVKGSRISEENKKSPLTVESLDLLAIKETPSSNFYEGLGSLKGVDLTTASLGFQVINTRGFNSTSPVRSLQVIDGVDNQAPGLNFSLGNFLGSSELDILKVDIIVGASSAFYGPNAFNGVINMQTKSPFQFQGLSSYVKFGERNLIQSAARFAKAFTNKEGHEWGAFKINLEVLDADDWEAENFSPVFDGQTDALNPGGFDAVNIYGDEYNPLFDQSSTSPWNINAKASGIYHRTGYKESDLLEYETRNLKSNAAFHIRTNPEAGIESPEFILASSFSKGTTIYQGENRFSLRDILFFQNRLEFKKKDKFFIRAYATQDDAGNTYDPFFTALQLQELSKDDIDWNSAYLRYWQGTIIPRIDATGYPQLEILRDENGDILRDSIGFPLTSFDFEALDEWNANFQDSLFVWHAESENAANLSDPLTENFTKDFLEPGTERFDTTFNAIINTRSGEVVQGVGALGTKLVDQSALYHLHGEYNFEPEFLNYWKLGANLRIYRPQSEGTIFVDSIFVNDVGETVQNRITNVEYGIYTGVERKVNKDITVSATLRMDKNQNFDYLFSPAASIVYTPGEGNYLRVSFSSAIRNPTLSDQYLDFNVGPATLRGNLDGVDSLVTVESFVEFRKNLFRPEIREPLEFFSIDAIRPEKVKTFEVGYRTTLFEKLYVDASYYRSIYDDFIGFNIGLDVALEGGFPVGVNAFRYSANSTNTVTTQGASIGLNYFLGQYYKVGGNYSWNRLNTQIDDPIIPAFNTPEHKFNLSFSARNIPMKFGGINKNTIGFSVNYKWIQGFIFEGSPQFTGPIEDYGLVDAQVSYLIPNINSTFKIGSSNLLNNQVFQTYGGPLVGRLAYISLTYDFNAKK